MNFHHAITSEQGLLPRPDNNNSAMTAGVGLSMNMQFINQMDHCVNQLRHIADGMEKAIAALEREEALRHAKTGDMEWQPGVPATVLPPARES